MKPGFLLEAARKNATSLVQGGLVICAISALVLLLNGKYVYNWVAGPFTVSSILAESPGTKEFGRIRGSLIPTRIAEKTTMTLRVLRRAVETSSTRVSANYYLFPLDGRFLVVKTAPDFSGSTASGRMVPLPEHIRSFPNLYEIKIADDRALKSDELYPTMLDATFSYRADANLFVIIAAFFLAMGLLATPISIARASNPQKYPMLRLVARTGVQSTLRRIEQEFIAAGDGCQVGPLLISSAWVYDPGSDPLVFPLKDVIGVTKKAGNKPGKPPSYSVEFWLRSDQRSHSVKAGDKECDAIINAIHARIPWAVIEPGSTFESDWRRDRQVCIGAMERRKKQVETVPLVAK
jgi:hypothetical protein